MMDRIAEKIFSLSPAEETEVLISEEDSSLTRFADNEITQNVNSLTTTISIRMLDKQKTASCEITNYSDESIKTAVDNLWKILPMQVKDERLQPLPEKIVAETAAKKPDSFSALSEQKRAEFVNRGCRILAMGNASGIGICSNFESRRLHATSKGYRYRNANWGFSYSLSAKNQLGITRDEFFGTSLDSFSPEKTAETALSNLEQFRRKSAISPGHYDIILTPYAFAELLHYLYYFTFSAKAYHEKTSALAYHLGEKLFSDKLTIADNPLADNYPKREFDYEGNPTTKTMMVDKGWAKKILSDRYFSTLLNVENTGNCLSPTTHSIYPIHPEVSPGTVPMADLIGKSEKALLVNRLHYLNIMDPITLQVTGMTRDGVFTVNDGKVTGSVNNLRFTESIIRALADIEDLSTETVEAEWWFGFMSVPAVKIRNFNFTSVTDF